MALPNFLLLGPPRCGTTRMFRILGEHPDVFVPRVKEPCYFAFKDHRESFTGPGDDDRVRNRSEYERLFDGSDAHPLRGEASPLYLWHPEAARNIREELPNAKLIAILRNPIDRCFSHYMHHKMAGRDHESTFEASLRKEAERKAAGYSPFWFYREVGRYDEQIPRYSKLFPREQLRFYLFEDFQNDPSSVLADLSGYLSTSSPLELPPATLGRNASGEPRSARLHRYATQPHALKEVIKPLIPASLRQRLVDWVTHKNLKADEMSRKTRLSLIDEFSSSITKTGELIGRDLSHWLKPHE